MQSGVQALGPSRRARLVLESRRHLGEPSRHRQLVDDGSEVEPGSPHEQGTPAAPLDVAEHVTRLDLEPAEGELLVGIDEIHEVIRHVGRARPRVGLAVPMSMARYTHIESTDTSSTPVGDAAPVGAPRRTSPTPSGPTTPHARARRVRAGPRALAGRDGNADALSGRGGDTHQLALKVMRRGVGDRHLGVGPRPRHPGRRRSEVHELVLAGPTRCIMSGSRELGPSTMTSSTRPMRA